MDGGQDGYMGWILAGVSSVIAALAGAVATLFKINESRSATAIAELKEELRQTRESMQCRLDDSDKKHEECQEDRNTLRIEIATIRAQITHLEAGNGS